MTEIAAGSAPEIKDRIRWLALYRIQKGGVVLADIVVPRTLPERLCESVVIREGRFAKMPDLFRSVQRLVTFHRSLIFSSVPVGGSGDLIADAIQHAWLNSRHGRRGPR